MQPIRKPTEKELKLLELLIGRAGDFNLPQDWKDNLLVQTMEDGGMGSLLLFPYGTVKEGRLFGEQVSRFQFRDADGIDVIVSLFVDKGGQLFEIDSWKTNFSPLISVPDNI